MVGCQDCIHYEVCDYRDPAIYKTIQELKNDCCHCIPTEDVVPRAEVKRLVGEYYDKCDECRIKCANAVAMGMYAVLSNEITDAISNNYEVIKEREIKHNVNRFEDGFCMYCDGKIHALSGILYFIEELIKKKYTEVSYD